MDETTAIYCSDYLCERNLEKSGLINYFGYDVNEMVDIRSPYNKNIA